MQVRQLYFIQARTLGHVKIGISADASRRIADLQVGCPDELVVRGVFLVENAEAFEAKFHRRFAHLHIRGEWFRNDRELEGVMQNAFSLHEVDTRNLPVIAMGTPPRESAGRRLYRATGESTEAFVRRATRWANKRLDEMEAVAA